MCEKLYCRLLYKCIILSYSRWINVRFFYGYTWFPIITMHSSSILTTYCCRRDQNRQVWPLFDLKAGMSIYLVGMIVLESLFPQTVACKLSRFPFSSPVSNCHIFQKFCWFSSVRHIEETRCFEPTFVDSYSPNSLTPTGEELCTPRIGVINEADLRCCGFAG